MKYFSTVFLVGILQAPVGGCEKYQKLPNTRASCMCDFEASARPINILMQKGHTPCYLLVEYFIRKLKGQVPNENTSSKKATPNGQSRAIARVERGDSEQIFIVQERFLRHLGLEHAQCCYYIAISAWSTRFLREAELLFFSRSWD